MTHSRNSKLCTALGAANESPVSTISDLVAQARTRAVNVGTYSAGYQLAMEWVALTSKTKLTYVPYKGQA